VPLPERSLLWAAGVFVWQGRWSLAFVLGVGITAAVLGDKGGYGSSDDIISQAHLSAGVSSQSMRRKERVQ
jgi:hypothetical protein